MLSPSAKPATRQGFLNITQTIIMHIIKQMPLIKDCDPDFSPVMLSSSLLLLKENIIPNADPEAAYQQALMTEKVLLLLKNEMSILPNG